MESICSRLPFGFCFAQMASLAVIDSKEERIDPVTVLQQSRGGFSFVNAKRFAATSLHPFAWQKLRDQSCAFFAQEHDAW